jgi:TonB family protein
VAACVVAVSPLARAQSAPQQEPAPGTGAVPSGGAGAAVVQQKPPPSSLPKADLQPPQLTRFVPAAYPPEAEKKGLEGNVVMQIDVGADGRVTAVAVLNPAGHGFDEAAAAAARQFVFAPALRDGKPVPARILYRYSFSLQVSPGAGAAAAEGAAAPAPAVPSRNLAGVVRSSAGEVPIAGATVTLRADGGVEKVARTGADGSWAFLDLVPGTYTVLVQAPGYQKLDVQERVVAGEATDVVYRLTAEGEIQVVVRGKRPPREVTKRTLERREIERIPGTNGDALKSLQSLPGVARPPGFIGLLIVRGSAPYDTAVFVDGTFIPLLYHFGGLSSAVPTELLDKIDFYPGNFSAQFGRVTGGIVDVAMRSPKSDGRYHGMVQIDLIDARALLEGPVPLAKGWNFAAAMRRSWVDVWLKPVFTSAGASVTAAPVYYDWQAYAETKPTDRSSLRLSFFGSDDRLEILTKDTFEQEPLLTGNIGMHTGFYRGLVKYQADLSDQVSVSSSTAIGKNTMEFSLGSLFMTQLIYPLSNRSEVSWRASRGVTLHGGVDMIFAWYDAVVRAPSPPRAGEPDPGPFATRPPLSLAVTGTAFRPAAYTELELVPHRRVKLVPGARVDYAKDTKGWDLSPRFNARYLLVEEFPKTTLKGGYGLFQRPPEYQESIPPFGSPGLHSVRAVQYSLGFEQDLTRQVETSVEGFYKKLDQLVSRTPSENGQYEYNNLGTGYVVGSEFLVKYKPDARFFGWLAYTLSRSVRQDGPDQASRLFQWDQTHVLTVLGSYRLGRGWEFGARYRIVSGSLWTPIVGSLYNASSGAYAPIDSPQQFSERLPVFNQLDLRVDKRWNFEAWRLSTYLDVQNVYYAQNVEGYNYNYNYTQRTPITGLPIIPSLGIRGDF